MVEVRAVRQHKENNVTLIQKYIIKQMEDKRKLRYNGV